MRYPLDTHSNPKDSLLFWIARYVKHKVNTLSQSRTTNKQEIKNAISFLNDSPTHIEDISEVVKRLRTKANFDGVKTFYLPIKAFYEYIDEDTLRTLRDIDEDYVIDFLSSATATYSDSTKVNYKNALVNFFLYLSKNNENEEGTGNGFIYNLELGNWQGLSGKSGKKTPAYLNEKEIKQFLDSLDEYEFTNDRTALFYNLFVRIILFTGVRVSEAISIERNRVQESAHEGETYLTFPIKGKGNYNRDIDVKKAFIEPFYSQWLSSYAPNANGLLFSSPSNSKKEVSASSVSTKIKELLRSAGISKAKEGAHLLRHSYGTLLYDKTKDLALVQDALGHNDPNTTRVYTHIDKDRMRNASSAFDDVVKDNKMETK